MKLLTCFNLSGSKSQFNSISQHFSNLNLVSLLFGSTDMSPLKKVTADLDYARAKAAHGPSHAQSHALSHYDHMTIKKKIT